MFAEVDGTGWNPGDVVVSITAPGAAWLRLRHAFRRRSVMNTPPLIALRSAGHMDSALETAGLSAFPAVAAGPFCPCGQEDRSGRSDTRRGGERALERLPLRAGGCAGGHDVLPSVLGELGHFPDKKTSDLAPGCMASRLADTRPTGFALPSGTCMLSGFPLLRRRSGRGALAQLVERLHGMQEVRGSNPLSSTILVFPQFRGLEYLLIPTPEMRRAAVY